MGSLEYGPWLTYSKYITKWSRKTATDVTTVTPRINGNVERRKELYLDTCQRLLIAVRHNSNAKIRHLFCHSVEQGISI